MKGSEYIAWAKVRHGVRYNLASSGVVPATLARLDPGEEAPEALSAEREEPEALSAEREEPEALSAQREDLAVNGPNQHGWPPLREAIAARYGVAPECVVLEHGASMANHLAMATLLERGDEVLVEHPAYEPLHTLPRYLGAEVRFFERPAGGGWALDPERVRRALGPRTRLVVVSDLHNPTGALADPDALARIAALGEERGFHLLVDEVYLEWLHHAGHGTAARLSPRVVATRSLTKAYGLDGLRAGWILAAPALAERMRALQSLFSITIAHPSERLATLALRRAEALAAPLRELLATNRALVERFVAEHPSLSWTPPVAGTVAFLHYRGDVDDLVHRLETHHDTTVAPGRFFGDPAGFRIGFGMATEVLREGLERVGKAISNVES
jgi:aspartate/methionine/tyrosine aminotransferase